MVARKGYKLTEVGEIPEDWEVESFNSIFSFTNGVNAGKECYGDGVRFVNVLEPIMYSHIWGPEIPGRVLLSKTAAIIYSVHFGDVLFNRTSETDSELGLGSVYLGKEYVVFGGFVIRGRPKNNILNPLFSGYALRSPLIRKQIIPLGQGAIRSNIGQKSLSSVLLAIPTANEQAAIATALSDADAFIDALEQCIAKKRHIKQGAMQELLTGKRRLPGFKGEWDKKTLDLCVTTSSGGTPPRNNAACFLGNIPWVTTSELNDSDIKETNENISEAGLACSAAKIFPENTVLMAMYGATIGKLGIILNAAATNQACCAFLCDEIQIHYRWLYYFLLSKRVEIVSLGCGAGQPNISQEIIKKILLYLPLINEQAAIAAVLTAMDDEIAALEAKLSKAKQIKAGMMQELLTGRTRLV